MSSVEDLLTRTLRDPARALPVPADPVPAIRHRARAQRRNTALGLAAVVLVVAATVFAPSVVGRVTRPTPVATDPAPQGSGLLDWPPSGPLSGDAGLVGDAADVWGQRGTRLVWAGRVGADRAVLLQGLDAHGVPMLAEVADGAAGLGLLRAEPITDPGIVVVRLAAAPDRAALLVRPGGASVGLLDSTQVWQDPPVDGVVTVGPGRAGGRLVVLDLDGRVIGDGPVPAAGTLTAARGPVRLFAPGWQRTGGYPTPQAADYVDGAYLAQQLGGGPVEVAVLDQQTKVNVPGGPARPRFYEVRRNGRTYLGSALWLGGRPYCLTLIDAGAATSDALVLRCWLPSAREGLVAVVLREGIQLAELRIDTSGPGQRPMRVTPGSPALRGGLTADLGSAFPTGPGLLRLEDYSGQARPSIRLPAYKP
jgi:hypothetical protein